MKYLLSLCLLAATTIAQAQTEKEVQALFNQYSQMMVNREFAKSLDLIYPELFNFIPRKEMEDGLMSSLNDTSMFRMTFKEMKIIEISNVYTAEKLSYSMVDYSITTVMDFINPETTEEEIFELGGIFNDFYGPENFQFKHRQFTVTTANRMAAIKTKGDKKLYMLEINQDMRPIIQQLLGDIFIARAFAE